MFTLLRYVSVVVILLGLVGFASPNPASDDVRGAGAAEGRPAMGAVGDLFAATLYAQQPSPQQQEEFVPIDELPAQDQLPAAPLLVAAYSFVVLALFAYVVSVARRLSSVQRELEQLGSELKRSGRA